MTGWSALAFALAGIGFLLFASPAQADEEGTIADAAPASTAPAEEAVPSEPATEAVDESSAPVAAVEPSSGQAATVVIENNSSGGETVSGSVTEQGGTATSTPTDEGSSESTLSSETASPVPETTASVATVGPVSTGFSATPLSTTLAPAPDPSQATEDAELTVAASTSEAASDLSGDRVSTAAVALAGCATPDAQCGADDSPPGSPLRDTSSTGVSASASSSVSASGGHNLNGSGGVANDASADCSDSNGSGGSDVVTCIAVGKGRLANGIGIGGDTQAGTEGSAQFSNNYVFSSYSGGPFAASLFASNSSLTG